MKRLRSKSAPARPARDGATGPGADPAPTPGRGRPRGRAGRKRGKARLDEEPIEQLSRPELVAAVRELQEELACEMLRAELELSGMAAAQSELEASLHRYADLFDQAPVGYLSLRLDGHIVHANLTAAAMLGKDRQRLLGHTVLHLIAREDRRVMLKHLVTLRRKPTGVAMTQEVRLNAPGQEVRVVQFTSMHIGKEIGADRIRVAILDVSARRQAEEHLRVSEERMRHLLQTALDAVVAFEADDTITGWNPQAELIFGWTAAEAIGRKLVDTFIPPRFHKAHLEGLQHYLATGRGPMVENRFEMTALHSNGREFPVELAIMPLVLEDRVSFGAFLRDISERKAGELARQRHLDELAAANLDLERFNRAAVGRELRMIELKREVNELRLRAGLPPRYDLDFAHQPAAEAPAQPAAEPAAP